MNEQEATKQRLRELIDELTAAVFGTNPRSRPKACICRDLHLLGSSPEGKVAGYSRPYDFLEEWAAFSVTSVSKAEQERRRLVDLGWASVTDFDHTRHKMAEEARKAAAEFEASRAEQRKREQEEFQAANKPITRASLDRELQAVLDRVW